MIEPAKPSLVEFIRRRGFFVVVLLIAAAFIGVTAIILFGMLSTGQVNFGLVRAVGFAAAGLVVAATLMGALNAARRRKSAPPPMIAPPKPSLMEKICRLGLFVCVLLAAAIVVIIFTSQELDPGTFVLLWFAVIILSVTTVFFMRKLPKLTQKRRDDYALSIFNDLKVETGQEFAVFLRPFYLTGQIVQSESSGTDRATTMTYEFEGEIIGALAELMPALALGRPGEAIGVGRILTDESTWKTAAAELMSRSSLIICVPSAHHGTAWELEQIVQKGYLAKTLFFMPISVASFSSLQHQRDDWNLVVEFMGRYGVTFPRYREVSPINRSEINYALANLGATLHDLRAAHWRVDGRTRPAGGVLFSVKPEGGFTEENVDLRYPATLRDAIQRLRSETAEAVSVT
jgi:predicted membrane channel-forming protein YqfA (hemolysin III family)